MPPDWPPSPPVVYLATHSHPSPLLPASLHARFCSPVPDATSPFHPSAYTALRLEIRPITTHTPFVPRPHTHPRTPHHPALGQHGLFTLSTIPPHTFIRPYLGLVHTEAESDPHSEYDMALVPSLSIDATHMGNESRFINDFRSVMPRPNCELRDWAVPSHGVQGMGVFSASRPIRAGTELTISYGKGFWRDRVAASTADDDHRVPLDTLVPPSSEAGRPSVQATVSPVHTLLQRQRNRLAHISRSSPQPKAPDHT